MTSAAGKRLWEMAENTHWILEVEWLAAVQDLDPRNGLKTSPKLEKGSRYLYYEVPFYEQDRYFARDIIAATELLASRCLTELVSTELLSSLKIDGAS